MSSASLADAGRRTEPDRDALLVARQPSAEARHGSFGLRLRGRGLVRRARREAGLPEHVTLAQAARLYINRTEQQRLIAARRGRAFVEALEAEHKEAEDRNDLKSAESK